MAREPRKNRKKDTPLDRVKEEKFCQYYATCLNGTKSAIHAGFAASSAAATASRLLNLPHVRQRLQELIDLSPTSITNIIACIAKAELTDVVEFDNDHVTVRSSADIPPRARAALKSIKVRKTPVMSRGEYVTDKVEIEVAMHDKLAATRELARIFKVYPESMSVLDAMQVLLQEGIASEEEANVLGSGLEAIKQSLYNLRRNQSTEQQDDAV